MTEQTIKCKICGNPYKAFSFYAGDQSACHKCKAKAARWYDDPYIHPLKTQFDLKSFANEYFGNFVEERK